MAIRRLIRTLALLNSGCTSDTFSALQIVSSTTPAHGLWLRANSGSGRRLGALGAFSVR